MVAFALRHGTWLLAGAVFVGLLAPSLAAALRPGLTFYIAALLYFAMLRIPWQAVDTGRWRVVAIVGLWLLLLNPLLAWGVVHALSLPPGWVLPVVLTCAVPPILSAPSLALLLRLDAALLLGCVTTLTLVCPLTLAWVPGWLLGMPLGVAPLDLLLRFGGLVGGTFLAAALTRAWLGNARLERRAAGVEVLGLVMLIAFAIGIMDGVAGVLVTDARRLLSLVALVFAVNLLLQALGLLAFLPFGRRTAASVGFASGNRNLALWVAVLPLEAGSDTMLYVAAAQFPIYLLPALLAPVYARLGRAPKEE